MARQRFMTPLRWSDVDVYGHVNNVQFLRLLEDARVLAFYARAAEDDDLPSPEMVVASHRIDYLRPLNYRPSPIAIDLWVPKVSAVSFRLSYEVIDDQGEYAAAPVVYARAESIMVPYDVSAGRPRRIAAKERELFDSWYDDPISWRHR